MTPFSGRLLRTATAPPRGRRWRPRVAYSFILLAVLALLVAACGQDEDGDPAVGEEDEADAGEEEDADADTGSANEPTITVGMGEDGWQTGENNLKRFPAYPSPNASVCEEPLGLTTDFDVEPRLATDWEYVGDNTFRFELREDIEFTDGTPFNAEAFVESVDYKGEEPSVTGLAFVEPGDAVAVDEYTVEITPSQPNLRLPQQVVHPSWGVLAPGSDPVEDAEGIHCTGPYTVEEYQPEESLTVVRNEDYWGEPGELDEMTFRFFPDDSARLLALEAGEVDAIAEVPRAQVSAVEEMPGVEVVRAPPGQVMMFYISRRGPDGEDKPTGDVDVRRAIAHAIDRDAYIEGVLGGEAERIDHVSPPAVLGEYADMVEGVPHDPAAAEQLLEDAGWEMGDDGVRQQDGEPLVLDIAFDPARVDLPTVEFVQSELSDIGIDAEIHQEESAVYRERINEGRYDLDLSTPNQNNANPAFLLNLRWYSQSFVDTAEWNAPGPDTRYEELIEEIHGTDDFDELQRLSAEAMTELVDTEVGAVPMAGTYRIYALHEDLEGFEPHPSGINQRWHTVSWSE